MRVKLDGVGLDLDIRVLGSDARGGHFDLGPADIGRAVEHLALKIRGIYDVEVDQAQRTHPGGGQVQGGR